MLCFEGISLMLKIFQGKIKSPNYTLVAPPDGKLQTITVKEEVREKTAGAGIETWLTMKPDDQNKTLRIRSCLKKCKAHTGEI
jgi:hypothetical protein